LGSSAAGPQQHYSYATWPGDFYRQQFKPKPAAWRNWRKFKENSHRQSRCLEPHLSTHSPTHRRCHTKSPFTSLTSALSAINESNLWIPCAIRRHTNELKDTHTQAQNTREDVPGKGIGSGDEKSCMQIKYARWFVNFSKCILYKNPTNENEDPRRSRNNRIRRLKLFKPVPHHRPAFYPSEVLSKHASCEDYKK